MSRLKLWGSGVFTAIVTFALVATAAMKITRMPKGMVDGIIHAGIPESAVVPIALAELSCLALYLIPRTRVLGAVLLTGYFGGAIVVHIIAKESVLPLILLGLFVWGGSYFRVPALQSLLPLRREQEMASREAADRGVVHGGHSAAVSRT